jgi:hypothetical protein
MKLAWLTLTLLSVGCSAHHSPSGGDAGADRDASAMCRPEVFDFRALTCPTEPVEAGPVSVTALAGVGTCCADVVPSVRVQPAPDGSFVLVASGEACDCCDTCRCAGPSEEVEVSLGELTPGVYTVRAGEYECAITVREPAMCVPGEIDELRMPAVLLAGDPLPMSFLAGGRGCGCGYRVERTGALSYAAERCDCCEVCECVDDGYETAIEEPPLELGGHTVVAGGISRRVSVFERSSCRDASFVSDLRIEPPRYDSAGNYWAVVGGVEGVCCVDPTPTIQPTRVGASGVIALEALFCADADCACVPKPQSYEAWHNLGPLEPGSYQVRIRDITRTFDVAPTR